jgi:hypothetical protein
MYVCVYIYTYIYIYMYICMYVCTSPSDTVPDVSRLRAARSINVVNVVEHQMV